jgi:AraC-like DNA-binding protein
MDDNGHQSGHLMLITPERVFYAGLLGRPRARCAGAFYVYVAIKGKLRLSTADDRGAEGELLVVPPNLGHTITSEHRSVICVTVEPESVRAGSLDALATCLAGSECTRVAHRVRAAYELLRQQPCRRDITSAEFDQMCFGQILPRRRLDSRVLRAIARMVNISGEPVTAESCAAQAGLSASRFLHLFKEQTGISFRSFRAWKRARYLLQFANQDVNLAHLAQDIGYPDSTHFSHSIRRFYGLKPRAIFSGSRHLAIYFSAKVESEPSAWTQERT